MAKSRKKTLLTLIGVFILSTSLFIYEILITRLFSTMLLKHLVFFTISLAILGIGTGGFIAYKSKKKINYEKLSLLLGLSYTGTVMMIYKLPYIKMLAFYILVSSIPFVIGGMILSLAFLKNNEISNKLYFADLLGSTLGSILIIPSTVDAVNKFKDFNGDIYNYKGVNAYIDDGRNFIEKTDKKYNNIYLSMVMTNSVNNGGLSMSENYIYTKEAYRAYFEHLKDDGYLSFMFHDAQDMFKGINTGYVEKG